MCAKLLVLSGDSQGSSYDIEPNQQVVVGTTSRCNVPFKNDLPDDKVASIGSTDDGWYISVEEGYPWIVDSQVVQSSKRLRLRENSLIRLSASGPDLRFRLSLVGDAIKDIQPSGTLVKSASRSQRPAEIPAAAPATEPRPWDSMSATDEWEPSAGDNRPRYWLMRVGLPAAIVVCLIAAIYVFFFR